MTPESKSPCPPHLLGQPSSKHCTTAHQRKRSIGNADVVSQSQAMWKQAYTEAVTQAVTSSQYESF